MTYFQVVRLLHYYAYSHVRPRRRVTLGDGATLAPNVSLRNGERIAIGADYGLLPDQPIAYQERQERDVVIGDDVWLGARAFVGAGVTIGSGCVVSAGSVVTKSLPDNSVAVGNPARIVRRREDYVPREAADPAGGAQSERASEPARREVEGAT
jgi:acetyltransferase-like isoleucine patch superfamily enzyme